MKEMESTHHQAGGEQGTVPYMALVQEHRIVFGNSQESRLQNEMPYYPKDPGPSPMERFWFGDHF